MRVSLLGGVFLAVLACSGACSSEEPAAAEIDDADASPPSSSSSGTAAASSSSSGSSTTSSSGTADDASAPPSGDGGNTDASSSENPEPDSGSSDAGSDASGDAAPPVGGPFTVTSPTLQDGGNLPCSVASWPDGPARSPALSWTPGPAGTLSYAVVIRSYGYFPQWIIHDIPASVTALPAAIPVGTNVANPAGAKQVPGFVGLKDNLPASPDDPFWTLTVYARPYAQEPAYPWHNDDPYVAAGTLASGALATTTLRVTQPAALGVCLAE